MLIQAPEAALSCSFLVLARFYPRLSGGAPTRSRARAPKLFVGAERDSLDKFLHETKQKRPEDKYIRPVASSHEFGWEQKPLVKENPRFGKQPASLTFLLPFSLCLSAGSVHFCLQSYCLCVLVPPPASCSSALSSPLQPCPSRPSDRRPPPAARPQPATDSEGGCTT